MAVMLPSKLVRCFCLGGCFGLIESGLTDGDINSSEKSITPSPMEVLSSLSLSFGKGIALFNTSSVLVSNQILWLSCCHCQRIIVSRGAAVRRVIALELP